MARDFTNKSDLVEAKQSTPLRLGLTDVGVEGITLKRFGRNADLSPYFVETKLGGLELAGRETIMLTFNGRLSVDRSADETPDYGDKTSVKLTGMETFTVSIDELENMACAYLRVGVGRVGGTDRDVQVRLDGHALTVPVEDSAKHLEGGDEYGSTKIVRLAPSLLSRTSTVKVSLPDGKTGGVGSVVLRVAHVR